MKQKPYESVKGNSKNRPIKQGESATAKERSGGGEPTQLAAIKREIVRMLTEARGPIGEMELEGRLDRAGFIGNSNLFKPALDECFKEGLISDELTIGQTMGWELRREEMVLTVPEIERVRALVEEQQRNLLGVSLKAVGYIHLLALCLDTSRDAKGSEERFGFFGTVYDTNILDGLSTASADVAESIQRELEKTEDALGAAARILRELAGKGGAV